MNLSISVCIPVYRGSHFLPRALNSLRSQNYRGEREVLIADDTEATRKKERQEARKIIRKYADLPIKFWQNKKNLGSARNIKKLAERATGDIIFFLCQDDVLLGNVLEKVERAFTVHKNIGVLTRPFYWFEDGLDRPVRAVPPADVKRDRILSIFDGPQAVISVFNSVGQISGLAYRKKFLETGFSEDIFVGHIYPFAAIWKKHPCMFLEDYTVAVGIKESQTRHKSAIYNLSPTEQWVKMFQTVFAEEKYRQVREVAVKNISTHFTGLVQIKNYSTYKNLICEIGILLKYHWQSIFYPKFWGYVLLTIFVPRKILIFLTDNFKRYILAKKLQYEQIF